MATKQKTDAEIAREWEKDWWSDYYPLCKQCVNTCKQSHKILDMYCPKFVQMTEEDKPTKRRTKK